MKAVLAVLIFLTASALGATTVITAGGRYTGVFSNDVAGQPTLRVTTTQPVVIAQATVSGVGALIDATGGQANLTVDGCVLTAKPGPYGTPKGTAIEVYEPARLVVTHNRMVSPQCGVHVVNAPGGPPSQAVIQVLQNDIENIDGRRSDGHGGYLPTMDAWGSDNCNFSHAVFLQFVRQDPNVVVSWNQIVNLPGQSAPGDCINVYGCSGTASAPVRIHNNYVQGIFPSNLMAVHSTGSGIVTDNPTTDPTQTTQWVDIEGNQVVNFVQTGIALYAGLNCRANYNRLVSAGIDLQGGFYPYLWACGLEIYDSTPGSGFASTMTARGNVIGAMLPKYEIRCDTAVSATVSPLQCTYTSLHDGYVTRGDEESERALWDQKVQEAGVQIGPGT
ncbi:MAG TPA: hypothetical protein VGD78_19870 [Chthoniobacterales bacterium]